MFEGFEQRQVATSGASINLVTAGDGPPLLLLHGYPQTHAMWHKVAPQLAQQFTVVAADLRGYGDSSAPPSDAEHAAYCKRTVAQDMVEVMAALGHTQFAVAAHDRGARVAHRLTLDHPQAVTRLALLDIVPTREMFAHVDRAVATSAWHWFFMIQPEPLPERLMGGDADWFIRSRFPNPAAGGVFTPEAVDEYARCFTPAAIHAMCEDYRAAATIDLVHDEADFGVRQVTCPLLVLWGERGGARGRDVLGIWRQYASDVRGREFPCGHFLAEERPDDVVRELLAFMK